MSAPVELIALHCVRCNTPVPAAPDQFAWRCATCDQGLQLDEQAGLRPLAVHFARADREGGLRWRPFWVAGGTVGFHVRQTYGRSRGPDELWQSQRTFVLPAFACTLEQAGAWGASFLRQPLPVAEGPAVPFEPVTVDPASARALAEFVVLTIEAERRDHLKQVEFTLELQEPVLWALPFPAGDAGLQPALAR